ncbi:MAG: hypothetical protein HPY83_09275 [Anaerolineae bacterium]|nr:hypothetical protein [Anaerolineae bacterium]
MPIYADYISVNQDFEPIFSQEVDRRDTNAWRSFIPHADWLKTLDHLLRALERGTASDRRPLLLHGAYGTGKTFAAFVLKHLLEDDLDEVRSYLATQRAFREQGDLERRLLAAREQGDHLVAYRSGSAHVTNSFTLLGQVQEGVRQALLARGYELPMTPTLYQAVLEKLDGPDSSFNWQAAFRRHESTFPDFSDADGVIRRLRTGVDNEENAELLARVHQVMSEEGYMVLGDPEAVKAWLGEVIEAAQLKSILFIWDEFTEYFRQNPSTTTLQELAHLSASEPFYLFLITHKAPEVARQYGDQADWRRLLDRFTVIPYQMATVTAYHLMAGAINVNPQRQEEWESRREAMWGWVAAAAKMLVTAAREGERREDFKALVPIHPYAAFLLSTISREFSSSERTLFRWLRGEKGQEDPLGSFPRFLRQDVDTEPAWLTADALWDYFFLDENLELADKVRDIVSYYRSRSANLGDRERQALRAVLLLIALERQMGQVDPRLLPRQKNVLLMLVGTRKEAEAMATIESLVHQDVVRQLPGPEKEYTIAASSVDHVRVRGLKEGLPRFEQLVQQHARGEALIADEALRWFSVSDDVAARRQALTVASAAEFLKRRERVFSPRVEPYQIAAVLIVSQDDEEVRSAEQLSRSLARDLPRGLIAVSQVPFGRQRWEDWREQRAHELYYQEIRDTANATVHADRAKRLLEGWGQELAKQSLRVFFREMEEIASGASGYGAFLRRVIASVYRYRPELISPVSTLHRDTFGRKGASISLGAERPKNNPYRDFVNDLQRLGLWDPSTYRASIQRQPEHPLSKMQQVVDAAFAQSNGVSLRQLWGRLQDEPIGLMPSPMGIVLMGLLLRDYCDGHFWADGISTFPLNPSKLAELIDGVMKGKSNATVCAMTREAQDFCQLVSTLFSLPAGEADYPDTARRAAREALKRIGYPIWLLRLDDGPPLRQAVVALEELLRDTNESAQALEGEVLRRFVEAVTPHAEAIQAGLSSSHLSTNMLRFLEEAEPGVLEEAKALGLELDEVVAQLKAVMHEEVWLWREEQIRERLPEAAGRLKLLKALNDLLGVHDRNLVTALDRLRGRVRGSKLPLAVLAAGSDDSTARVLQKLATILDPKEAAGGLGTLAEELNARRESVRRALDGPQAALVRWADRIAEITLSDSDGYDVWQRLPDMSDRPPADLRQEVLRQAGELHRNRLAAEAVATWQRLTGSASPRAWSEARGLPIQWLLDSPAALEMLGRLNDPSGQSESSLGDLLAYLDAQGGALQALGSGTPVTDALLALVPEYDGVLTESDVAKMHDHIRMRLGRDVGRWTRDRARSVAKEWVAASYRERLYQRVLDYISSMSETDARRQLQVLAEDPSVGLRLLAGTEPHP